MPEFSPLPAALSGNGIPGINRMIVFENYGLLVKNHAGLRRNMLKFRV